MREANMHEAEYQELKEQSWRRPLNAAEQARLRAHLAAKPHAQPEWELEERLSRCLKQLPNAPLSSNFTARVLQAAQRSQPKKRPWNQIIWQWLPKGLLPRTALVLIMASAGLLTFKEYQIFTRNQVAARSLASVSRVATLPEIEWLQDFDTISQLSRVEVADTELLSALE